MEEQEFIFFLAPLLTGYRVHTNRQIYLSQSFIAP
jgi:hypothetical protein